MSIDWQFKYRRYRNIMSNSCIFIWKLELYQKHKQQRPNKVTLMLSIFFIDQQNKKRGEKYSVVCVQFFYSLYWINRYKLDTRIFAIVVFDHVPSVCVCVWRVHHKFDDCFFVCCVCIGMAHCHYALDAMEWDKRINWPLFNVLVFIFNFIWLKKEKFIYPNDTILSHWIGEWMTQKYFLCTESQPPHEKNTVAERVLDVTFVSKFNYFI